MRFYNSKYFLSLLSLSVNPVEGKLHDSNWGAKEDCGKCKAEDTNKDSCGQTICVMNPLTQKAYTFNSVCEFMEQYWDKTEVVALHIGLGKCKNLLDTDGKYPFILR